ncbi:hypothetical protein TH53_17465 [Pedobacter lusitanus]|uniref:Uncharacterized protein n=1 Tax=Pedobacter lusitanus TaxID=1503925 RepID=A0A0D0F354_9SPHI|nr:hypothetical protein [Pedobacter lusitanus]KIO76008.1 hypothetical protein TH53_17465 [Pedobacter lusitanus]
MEKQEGYSTNSNPHLSDPRVFLPDRKSSGLLRKWIYYLTFLLITFLFSFLYIRNRHESIVFVSIFIIITVIIILTNKEPVSLSISIINKTLTYTYSNSWGQTRCTTVDLKHAGGFYKYDISKAGSAWKLVLYNDSIFRNRISIRARTAGGYSEEQLDEIVALVHQCK